MYFRRERLRCKDMEWRFVDLSLYPRGLVYFHSWQGLSKTDMLFGTVLQAKVQPRMGLAVVKLREVWTKNFKSSAAAEAMITFKNWDDVEMTVEGGASGVGAPADEGPFEEQMRLSYESQVRASTARRMASHRISINWRSGLKKNQFLTLSLIRVRPLGWCTWFAFCRCWRHRVTRRVLQIPCWIEYAIFTQVSAITPSNASRFAVSYLYILEKDGQVV